MARNGPDPSKLSIDSDDANKIVLGVSRALVEAADSISEKRNPLLNRVTIAALLLMVGGASWTLARYADRFDHHETIIGHPPMEQRVIGIEKSQERIDDGLTKLDGKMDRGFENLNDKADKIKDDVAAIKRNGDH